MKTKLLESSLRDAIARESKLTKDSLDTWNKLKDKNNFYGEEVRRLACVHSDVLGVYRRAWDNAVDAGIIDITIPDKEPNAS